MTKKIPTKPTLIIDKLKKFSASHVADKKK